MASYPSYVTLLVKPRDAADINQLVSLSTNSTQNLTPRRKFSVGDFAVFWLSVGEFQHATYAYPNTVKHLLESGAILQEVNPVVTVNTLAGLLNRL